MPPQGERPSQPEASTRAASTPARPRIPATTIHYSGITAFMQPRASRGRTRGRETGKARVGCRDACPILEGLKRIREGDRGVRGPAMRIRPDIGGDPSRFGIDRQERFRYPTPQAFSDQGASRGRVFMSRGSCRVAAIRRFHCLSCLGSEGPSPPSVSWVNDAYLYGGGPDRDAPVRFCMRPHQAKATYGCRARTDYGWHRSVWIARHQWPVCRLVLGGFRSCTSRLTYLAQPGALYISTGQPFA